MILLCNGLYVAVLEPYHWHVFLKCRIGLVEAFLASQSESTRQSIAQEVRVFFPVIF